MKTLAVALAAVLVSFVNDPLLGDDLLPPGEPIQRVVDHYVAARLQTEGVTPAPPAADSVILRRLTLDLAGRIPTVAEARAYAASEVQDKRQQLVDRLIASPDFALHQRNEFELLLLPSGSGQFREYLLEAFRANRPWDAMFREMLAARYEDDAPPGAAEFLKSRVSELDNMTNDTSALFFGVNISCAKCHDHPLVEDWKQDHFYGMQSFFSRTFLNGDFVGERDYGLVSFKTREGETKQAQLMFLSGAVLEEPEAKEPSDKEKKAEQAKLKELAKEKQPPPAPAYSRRNQLVEAALRRDDNVFFARAIVNRLWNRLFGYGLVMPLDQMHSENPASHPELLEWLARDLASHDYDLKRLIQGLVLSDAYARSSVWEGDERPSADLFAVAVARPLSPRQYSLSLRLATTSPDALPADIKPEDWAAKIESLDNAAGGFAALLDTPGEDFQVGVGEALLFSNNERIERDFLREGGDALLTYLLQLEDPRDVIDAAVWSMYSRAPAEEEVKLLGEFLDARADRPQEARQQLLWALLTSAELRFNY